MGTTPASPHPGADLLEVLDVAQEREGHLLSAGELRVLERIRALDPEARELYARLSLRAGPVFRVAALRYAMDVHAAIGRLAGAGLVHTSLPDDRCLAAFPADALRAACLRLGLESAGRREALEERLKGRRWVTEPAIALAHLGLLARLELFYFQRGGLDRSALVVERLGVLSWASYTPTGGAGLFPDRAALLRYERARAGAWTDDGEPLRVALAGPRPHGLSAWGRAVEAVLATDPSADVLAALLASGAPLRPQLALRLEREGRRAEALAVCRASDPDPAVAIALERTGRRLARGSGIAPLPLLKPRTRSLRLRPGRGGARPTWIVGGEARFVEDAVRAELSAAGRDALHAENWLWTSLYALVFRDLYWLPVPGMLPGPRRAGPLDVGTPAFYTRRREAVDARLAELRAEGTARFAAAWRGEQLAGLHADALPWSARVPGEMAAPILERLAREGWRAARGLPDLFLAPGKITSIPSALPSTLAQGPLLVEIKGPGDSLRDEQRAWHNHLLLAEIPVEVWMVGSQTIESG